MTNIVQELTSNIMQILKIAQRTGFLAVLAGVLSACQPLAYKMQPEVWLECLLTESEYDGDTCAETDEGCPCDKEIQQ